MKLPDWTKYWNYKEPERTFSQKILCWVFSKVWKRRLDKDEIVVQGDRSAKGYRRIQT